MQSKMLLGVLSALFTMALLFTLAVPRQRGQEAAEADPITAPAVSGRADALAVEPEPAPELVDGVWQPSGYALRMPAPEGWVASRRRSRAYLHRDPSRPLQGNFSLIRLPNLYGKTLEGLLEENREELEGNDQFELHDIALVELADVRRIRVDYTGTPRGGEPVRFAGLIWLQGREQVVLTFTIEAGLWKARAPEAERCLSGLAGVPAPAAAADEPAGAGAAR